MPKYIYIERQHQLDLALAQLQSTKVIAVDTESSGFYTYFSDLCLIQISTEQFHYVIDVLKNLNLDGLGKIFSDTKHKIIFHAASSDIRELKNAYNWNITNVFDTLLACQMITGNSCSLANVVENILNISLEKKEQKSNWKQRPLTKSQLNYAHLDTLYLIQIQEVLSKQLKELYLWEEFESECQFMEKLEKPENKKFNEDSYAKTNGIDQADSDTRGRIKEIHILRDKIARQENIASFRLISNDGIFRIAKTNPADIEELLNLRVASPRFINKNGNRILNSLKNYNPISLEDLPKNDDIDSDVMRRLKKLKKTRQVIANYRGMKPALIMGNKALLKIASETPQDIKALQVLDIMSPWKLKFYGNLLLNIIKGKPMGQIPETLPVLPPEKRHE